MKTNKGFTIVELLIVVVVIAILAAITVVAYTGIQNRTHDSVIQSDLKTIAKKFEAYKVDNGVYPVGDSQLQSTGIRVSKTSYGAGFDTLHNLLYCRLAASGPIEFALMADSKSGTVFVYRSSTGGITTLSSWPSTGSAANCQSAGINQTIVNDRDILKYNNAWASWL